MRFSSWFSPLQFSYAPALPLHGCNQQKEPALHTGGSLNAQNLQHICRAPLLYTRSRRQFREVIGKRTYQRTSTALHSRYRSSSSGLACGCGKPCCTGEKGRKRTADQCPGTVKPRRIIYRQPRQVAINGVAVHVRRSEFRETKDAHVRANTRAIHGAPARTVVARAHEAELAGTT